MTSNPAPATAEAQEALYRVRMHEAEVPLFLCDELIRYLVDRRRPGVYLFEVLSGHVNSVSTVKFLTDSVPSQSWGSSKAVEQWLARRGR